ncbi:MAG: DUF1963 domain-containing protein [Bacteroidales bacterium]|nr:DUF1963 domain-containing protein [Bacteroidales bacterium]
MRKQEIIKKIKSLQWEKTNADEISSFLKSAVGMKPKNGKIPVAASKFGGLPDLPKSLKWPSYKSREDSPGMFAATYEHVARQKKGCKLPFIAQFNISDFKHLDFENIFPEKGIFYFFSDTQPDEIKDHRILFYDGDENSLKQTPLPKSLKKQKKDEDFIHLFKDEFGFDFFEYYNFPSSESYKIDNIQLSKTDEENIEKMNDFIDETFGEFSNYLLGEPDNIQGDVYEAWMFDMFSIGVTNEEFQEQLEKIKKNMTLLFQLDRDGLSLTEDDDGWVGDGLVYFGVAQKVLKDKEMIKDGTLQFSAINCAYT